MPSPVSPARTAILVAAGLGLIALAYVAFVVAVLSVGVGYPVGAVVGWGLVAGGLACSVAALRQSLRRWQMTGRVPLVAVLYAVLGVAALGWWASGPAREAAAARANPDATSAEIAGDGIDVRDAAGPWHVPFAGCPAARGASSTRSHDGVVEVLGAGDRPVMRLDVAARRATCLPAAL